MGAGCKYSAPIAVSKTMGTAPNASGPGVNPAQTDVGVALTVAIVSFNDSRWLSPCLESLPAHLGGLVSEVIVVDNGSDGAAEMVSRAFPHAITMSTSNRGFGHANNVAIVKSRGRYVLFLNPDTEFVAGSLEQLIGLMEARPDLGVAGVKQIAGDGAMLPTVRYFPSFPRALGEALGSERWHSRPSWAGERELNLQRYEHEFACDWTSGSFMLIRREALLAAGCFDERFFLYGEEPDLCMRIKKAGWSVWHLPVVTIVHHADKAGINPALTAQAAFSRRLYAKKHLAPLHRFAYVAALVCGLAVRAVVPDRPGKRGLRSSSSLALRTLIGLARPPFLPPPETSSPTEQTIDLEHASQRSKSTAK
jgi:N-acetylglucosaminyl-diphospho-decaprenol L-rhamnosyltransferase